MRAIGATALILSIVLSALSQARAAEEAELFDGQPLGGPYEFEVEAAKTYKTFTTLIKAENVPEFNDDYDFRGLKLAIARQLKRLNARNLGGSIIMGGKGYPLTKVRDSLKTFDSLIDGFNVCVEKNTKDRCYADFNAAVKAKFNVFKPALTKKDPRFGKENFALFTGYNTHHIEGRTHPDGEFKHAIFANPRHKGLNSKTRVQIDFGNALGGRNLELVYVKSLFEVYMMHVQGSGKITLRFDDGTTKDFFLQYDGSNRQRWNFISVYMARKGYLVNGSIPAQRKYMHHHPEKEQEIYGQCPSYIYLKASNDVPKGSDVVPVTDGRTLAQDNATYPFKGLLAFVQSKRPVETGAYDMEQDDKRKVPFMPFARFMIDQDTGGAINGKARADIYFGSDDYAMFAAMYQAELGKVHFLLLK